MVYAPVLFLRKDKVIAADRLLLAFHALLLSSVQGVPAPFGRIVHGGTRRVLRVRIEPFVREVRGLLDEIAGTLAGDAAPSLILNRHCTVCPFQDACQAVAQQTDDLSLLRRLSPAEIEKHRGRGITSVTQLSYAYKPGRRGKRKREGARRHNPALQALAIRERKVYVVDPPDIPSAGAALYLDVEGVPERDFYYLIGLDAVDEGGCTSYSFWADDEGQSLAAWQACAQLIQRYASYTLYHYGQYELRFLDRMQQLAGDEGRAALEGIRANCCNVLARVYSHVYFPTYSNGLKDIGRFLGAEWSAPEASGIQSLAWRLAWESNREEALKQELVRYNQEDCRALRRVTEFVAALGQDATRRRAGGPAVDSAAQSGSFWFRKTDFFCPELAHIHKCAYSDYQRERVYFRTSPAVRKSLRRKARSSGQKRLRVNQHVECGRPERCPVCGGSQIHIYGRPNRKVVCVLRFSASGVRRWVIRYTSARYRCWRCKETFLADAYRAAAFRFGNDLCSWAVYNHVALRQSYDDITHNLNELFGYTFPYQVFGRIKPRMAERHGATYDALKAKLRRGNLIHADETKVLVKGRTGYVWVFTNLEEVVYAYTPTREGTILEGVLEGFQGVLVSDFYAAYDAARCPQQKCLVHLTRDLNDDLFHNPFDEELKQLAQALVAVLTPIIDTVDRFGLKHRFLNKHKPDAARFLRLLKAQEYRSEVARKYQKRIVKYEGTLFVFLDHDGIPWNNNNAESAIKGFACRRRVLGAGFTEKGMQDYLLFLSIYQTCRQKNVSFLRFLRSGLSDIDVFADARNPSQEPATPRA